MAILETIGKEVKSLAKPYEGFQKDVAKEGVYFLLGIALDAGKGMGWVGNLFVWPFVLAFVIGAFLLIRPLLLLFI
jgi:hypothetical protein